MTFGFRDLTEDEIEFVAGGIVVNGSRIRPPNRRPPVGDIGPIGFSGGWNWRSGEASRQEQIEREQENEEQEGEEIVVDGSRLVTIQIPPELLAKLELPSRTEPSYDGAVLAVIGDTCPTARAEAQEAINALLAGSSTMRDVIDAAIKDGQRLLLVKDMDGAFYNVTDNMVIWDPFAAFEGVNSNGTTWYHPPALALAHELLHFAMPNATEAEVIQMTNFVAAQMNQHFGTSFSTNRDQHHSVTSFLVNDAMAPYSTKFVLKRPGCGR